MARTNRKPRKGPPSKTRHGKEKKQLRKILDSQRTHDEDLHGALEERDLLVSDTSKGCTRDD